MLCSIKNWIILQKKIRFVDFANKCRCMTTAEVSTALRPFYFSVHPDLFGKFPNERLLNENSLKQLSSFIASLQSRKVVQPCTLQFHLRDKDRQNELKLITINLNKKDIRTTVLTVLKSCNLSTEYVDKIPKSSKFDSTMKQAPVMDMKVKGFTDFSNLEDDPIFGAFIVKRKIKEITNTLTLRNWLNNNYKSAIELGELHKPLQEEVKRLKKIISAQLGVLEIRWECGWNEQHFMGCLQSLKNMAEQYQDHMHMLKGRILVFAPFTGVSLDGYVMLNSGEVQHNWLDLIKNVKRYDEEFYRIPAFEKAVSQVLLDIQVVRRKFMPKILAGDYERYLQQLTTNLNDYLSRQSYPVDWPKSLKQYEIVVETEAGPLMVSPTGQFIAPSSCLGLLLVKFISENMKDALQRIIDYKRNKYIERQLHQQSVQTLELIALYKDDNITPDLMIHCCDRLIKHKDDLCNLKGIHLYITNYYSVLRDGTVCIPWNWSF